jgi:flagellin
MALTVATNTGALMAQAAASSVNKDMEVSMERLSTGKRINSASDDAAGVAIASRLTAEIKGTNQAIRNAMDGQSMIDTAEGAMVEYENILQRMREIAVQAANGSNNSDDRTNLNAEVQNLKSELNRIVDTTKWGGMALLDGTFASTDALALQIGARSAEILSATIADLATTAIGTNSTNDTIGSVAVDTYTNAAAGITVIDNAIKSLNTQRATLGSHSNRLDHAVSNLTNISSNLQAGKGRIEDADFAAETTNLAKTQILQQASTAMLAQANASKQNVLSLLQG